MDNNKKNKQMAFWRHDQYPYLLCGTVTKTLSNDYVETKEYGAGTTIKPCLILPFEKGCELRNELQELQIGRNVAIIAVNLDWNNKLNDIKKDFGIV